MFLLLVLLHTSAISCNKRTTAAEMMSVCLESRRNDGIGLMSKFAITAELSPCASSCFLVSSDS